MATAATAAENVDAAARLNESIVAISGLTIAEVTHIVVNFSIKIALRLVQIAFIWFICKQCRIDFSITVAVWY